MPSLPPRKGNILQPTILSVLHRLWCHLSRRRQWQFGLLLVLMIVSAFAEVVSLGAVLPFLGVLVAPERVLLNPIIADMARVWGITSANSLVLPLTVAFAVAVLVAGGIRILFLWASTRLAYVTSSDLSLEVYRRTLYQPFHVHVARNSSEVISSVTSKVSVVGFVALQVLTLFSSMLLLVAITLALLAINTMVALAAAISFGACYGLITWLCRKQLNSNARLIARGSTQMVKALQEGLGAIRDVLLDGTQPIYCEIYRRADRPLRLAEGNNSFISGSPRFAIEGLGMVLIAVLAYNLSRQAEGVALALPVLGALALGAQRLLPALQQSYSAWTIIVGNQVSLADTLELLDQPLPAEALKPAPAPLSFREGISFDGVRFRYDGDGPWVLDGFNLTIPKGGRVGLVGSTGSGKSTALDLLMGLADPTQGQIIVDGQPINGERRRAWQRTIAHVPQSIYLADTTFAENIAFGVPSEQINLDRVRKAAYQAQIAEFIESQPEGYYAMVGERGVRLSGGQRQRIGIARALYKQATVFVFDEATSALDNATEQEVMNAIEGLSRDLTIVMVAHRLSTVKRCDTVVELGGGQVVAQGTFENLLRSSPSFRNMAKEAG